MDFSSPAHVLVVANQTAATPKLLAAVRDRAERGPAWFHVLVPSPIPTAADWRAARREEQRPPTAAERVLAQAIALVEEAAHRPTDGSVSRRHDPMDAIEEAIYAGDFDEIILSTLAPGVSRWLHADLPRRVAHLGLPVTTVIADPVGPAHAPVDGELSHRTRRGPFARHGPD